MPELPDITAYVEAITEAAAGTVLEKISIAHPFLLRTVEPPKEDFEGRRCIGARRIGKRVVLEFDGKRFAVIHLMIAGRFKWTKPGTPVPRKIGLAGFRFSEGTLILTEAGTKRRASLHLSIGEDSLAQFSRGGLEVLGTDAETFSRAILAENHTLKRTLTDPRILSGIGNSFSDEILHRARLSPMKRTDQLAPDEIGALFEASVAVLTEWTALLRVQRKGGFPKKVTAFRPEMAVHGKYGQPCPECGTEVQRIRYAENECNYCPRCQTDGKLLSDRALSRLLKGEWPKTITELEESR